MREVPEIEKLISRSDRGAINLKNHGFFLYSNRIEDMEELVRTIEFEEPN